MIERWISSAGYSKQVSGVLNISSRATQWGSSGEEGVSKVLEIVTKVGRHGEYVCGLGGGIMIRRHHCGWHSARKEFA